MASDYLSIPCKSQIILHVFMDHLTGSSHCSRCRAHFLTWPSNFTIFTKPSEHSDGSCTSLCWGMDQGWAYW